MDLSDATVGQLLIPVEDLERGIAFGASPHVVHRTPTTELWLTEFLDPNGNRLALMSETPKRA